MDLKEPAGKLMERMTFWQFIVAIVVLGAASSGGGEIIVSEVGNLIGRGDQELVENVAELTTAVTELTSTLSAQARLIEANQCQIEYDRNGWGEDWRECFLEERFRTHRVPGIRLESPEP